MTDKMHLRSVGIFQRQQSVQHFLNLIRGLSLVTSILQYLLQVNMLYVDLCSGCAFIWCIGKHFAQILQAVSHAAMML